MTINTLLIILYYEKSHSDDLCINIFLFFGYYTTVPFDIRNLHSINETRFDGPFWFVDVRNVRFDVVVAKYYNLL